MEEPQYGFIYELRSKTSGKSYYGQTTYDPSARFEKHVNKAKNSPEEGCKHLNAAINLYGPNDFEIIVRGVYPIDELDQKEIEIIALYDATKTGYNISEGGGGYRGKRSEEFADMRSGLMRKHYREWNLGRGVCYWKNGDIEGFLVKLPGKAWKYFTDSKISMEKKAQDAIAYRDHIAAGGDEKPPRKQKDKLEYELPPFVYYKASQDGFSVELPGVKRRGFVTRGQLEDNLFRAMEFYLQHITFEKDEDKYVIAYSLYDELKDKLKRN